MTSSGLVGHYWTYVGESRKVIGKSSVLARSCSSNQEQHLILMSRTQTYPSPSRPSTLEQCIQSRENSGLGRSALRTCISMLSCYSVITAPTLTISTRLRSLSDFALVVCKRLALPLAPCLSLVILSAALPLVVDPGCNC